MHTIDLTPTWEEILPALIRLFVDGTTLEARQTAYEELTRMARLADKQVAHAKFLREAGKRAWSTTNN